MGFIPYAVVSSVQKSETCKKYGAKEVVCYQDNEKWEEELLEKADGVPFDAVLDCVCKSNVEKTVKLLAIDGRWILYGGLSGTKTEFDFGQLLAKRIKLVSTTLKSRSKEYKDNLISRFSETILPKFEEGIARTVIDEVIECDWSSANSFIQAHKKM